MKTITTQKTLFLATGEANRRLGNGFRAVVVAEGTVIRMQIPRQCLADIDADVEIKEI